MARHSLGMENVTPVRHLRNTRTQKSWGYFVILKKSAQFNVVLRKNRVGWKSSKRRLAEDAWTGWSCAPGSEPNPSGVKPAWTDSLRHLISSLHSWNGSLPTPRVKLFKPDSSSPACPLYEDLCGAIRLSLSLHKAPGRYAWFLRADHQSSPFCLTRTDSLILWCPTFSRYYQMLLSSLEMLHADP